MDEDFNYNDGTDWSGYDFGDSGYQEPFNYEPEGYQNPTWDTAEHYSYEPGPYSAEAEVTTPTQENMKYGTEPTKGKYNMLSKYNEDAGAAKKSDSLGDSISRGSGGGGGDSLRKYLVGTNTMTTMSKKFNQPLPTFSGPTLTMPEWDNEKVKRLRQSKANYGISSLRDSTNRALTLSRSSQTGYAARQALRDALAGYGKGISGVMKEAGQEAESEYGKEFAADAQKAQQEYNAKFQVANTMYQAALQAYLNDFTTSTQQSTSNVYMT